MTYVAMQLRTGILDRIKRFQFLLTERNWGYEKLFGGNSGRVKTLVVRDV
jgi:hypothetical protein